MTGRRGSVAPPTVSQANEQWLQQVQQYAIEHKFDKPVQIGDLIRPSGSLRTYTVPKFSRVDTARIWAATNNAVDPRINGFLLRKRV